jgi:hypothetical protein
LFASVLCEIEPPVTASKRIAKTITIDFKFAPRLKHVISPVTLDLQGAGHFTTLPQSSICPRMITINQAEEA